MVDIGSGPRTPVTLRPAASRSRTTDTVGAAGTSADSRGDSGDGGISVDLCQTVPGDQGRECPDSAVSVYSIPVERNVANLTITGSGSATVVGDNSEVAVEVGGVRDEVLASATSNGTLSFSKTYRNISRSISSEELTLSIETTGLAGARLDGVTIWKDTDGDGFTDQRERIGFETAYYGNIPTDPLDPDTDGDGLDDDEEIGEFVSEEQAEFVNGELHSVEQDYYRLNSHPIQVDTDDDRLNDSVEAGNWTVEVVNRNRTMYRWNSTEQLHPNESRDTVNFSSDPLFSDTDLDGLSDYDEKERYHTNPEARVTYGITREHQREVIGVLQAETNDWPNCASEHCGVLYHDMEATGFISHDSPVTMDRVGDLEGYQLSDATDDFDFVVPDDYAERDEQWSRFSFRSLEPYDDPEVPIYRTDVWLPNKFESSATQTDPWDPDTDDDGLTDGQEARGLTRIGSPEVHTDPAPFEANLDHPADTSPNSADSDGDGWWDGWIGVYGVGRSDNVILYNEHLHDDDDGDGDTSDDGVQGHEIVQEQIEYHNISAAPSVEGADIDGDDNREHSNVHIGERLLNTNPNNGEGDGVPDTDISVEVDNYNEADDALLPGTGWSTRIERNYRLYGLNVNLRHDDPSVSDSELGLAFDSPFGVADMAYINEYHKNLGADYYLFVADRAADSPVSEGLNPDQSGVTSIIHSDTLNIEITDMTMIFTDAHQDWTNRVPNHLGLTQNGKIRAVTAKTAVHEIGHQLSIGRSDDDSAILAFEEVYSGGDDDPTPEYIENSRTNARTSRWSVMSSGVDSDQYSPPSNGTYTAFSLEELTTLDHTGE